MNGNRISLDTNVLFYSVDWDAGTAGHPALAVFATDPARRLVRICRTSYIYRERDPPETREP